MVRDRRKPDKYDQRLFQPKWQRGSRRDLQAMAQRPKWAIKNREQADQTEPRGTKHCFRRGFLYFRLFDMDSDPLAVVEELRIMLCQNDDCICHSLSEKHTFPKALPMGERKKAHHRTANAETMEIEQRHGITIFKKMRCEDRKTMRVDSLPPSLF